jgi:hypothetical protein
MYVTNHVFTCDTLATCNHSLDQANQALVLRAIVPQCHLASLNPSVHAVWLVTNNDKRHALHVYSKCICTK